MTKIHEHSENNDIYSNNVISKILNMHECKTHSDLVEIIEILKRKKVVVYGAGKIGKRVCSFLSYFGITVSFFWDAKAELIKNVGSIPVTKPDFQQILDEDKEKYFIIITPFSENICCMIQNELIKAGFYNIIRDRKFINSLIYFKCKSDIYEKKFQFKLTTCFFCPNTKGVKNRCEIFDNNVEKMLIRDNLKINNKNGLVIPSIGLLISNKCNLRCKNCIHLRDYYKCLDNIDIETTQIFENLNKILNAAGFIHEIVIVGGEPFLHKDFESIIYHALRLHKIGIVHIITNGTIVPKNERIFKILSNPRIVVEISGYGNKISEKLQENVKLFITNLHRFHVNYRYTKQMQWYNFGNFENRGRSEEELSNIYSSCICISNDLFNDKLHKCSRSLFGTYLGLIPDFPSDYIDMNNISKEDMIIKMTNFFRKNHIEACNFCNGTSTITIEAGEQI